MLGHQHRREVGHALGALGGTLARRLLARSPRRASGGMRFEGRPSSRGDARRARARSCMAADTTRKAGRGRDQAAGATSSMRLRRSSTKARVTPGRSTSPRVGHPVAASRATRTRRVREIAQQQGRAAPWSPGRGLADADVELLVRAGEPAAAARCERSGLLELGQAKQVAVERARLVLAARGCGHLHVIDADDIAHPTTALRRSTRTMSRHVAPSLPSRSRVPTTWKPQRACNAMRPVAGRCWPGASRCLPARLSRSSCAAGLADALTARALGHVDHPPPPRRDRSARNRNQSHPAEDDAIARATRRGAGRCAASRGLRSRAPPFERLGMPVAIPSAKIAGDGRPVPGEHRLDRETANGPRACGGRARYRVRDSNPCYRRERPAS